TSGQKVGITTNVMDGDDRQIYITYQNFPKDVLAGESILRDDGKGQVRVISTNNDDSVHCDVVYGGVLTSCKGDNRPSIKVSIPSLTEEDLYNLEFALNNDVEWIGLSFVRTADDITELKRIISNHKNTARVVAKIEKPEAIDNIDAIIEVTDGVMV